MVCDLRERRPTVIGSALDGETVRRRTIDAERPAWLVRRRASW